METTQPTIKIICADGSILNVIKEFTPEPKHSFLERLSGLKYGKRDSLKTTLNILTKLNTEGKIDSYTFADILTAAESVVIDYFRKKYSVIVFYESEYDEFIVYNVQDKKHTYKCVFFVTTFLKCVLAGEEINPEDYFLSADLDLQSLIENLRYFENLSATDEDYEEAASFRDLIKELEKDSDTSENNRAA